MNGLGRQDQTGYDQQLLLLKWAGWRVAWGKNGFTHPQTLQSLRQRWLAGSATPVISKTSANGRWAPAVQTELHSIKASIDVIGWRASMTGMTRPSTCSGTKASKTRHTDQLTLRVWARKSGCSHSLQTCVAARPWANYDTIQTVGFMSRLFIRKSIAGMGQ